MRRINIAQITALLLAANAMALAAPHRRSFTGRPTGQVHGTVIDTNGGRVSGAAVTVEGEGLTRAVVTVEDGTYKIELPVGTYRIKAARTGFCLARRAPFQALSSTSMM
jgi:hypothetical protein